MHHNHMQYIHVTHFQTIFAKHSLTLIESIYSCGVSFFVLPNWEFMSSNGYLYRLYDCISQTTLVSERLSVALWDMIYRYLIHWCKTTPSFVQMIVCHRCGTKPLSEPAKVHVLLCNWEQFQLNSNKSKPISILYKEFENVAWKMSAILSAARCVS